MLLLTRALVDVGFATLVVDTSSESVPTVASEAWMITRPNVGWDFGSWASGVDLLGDALDGLDRLVLCNDSCFGPFGGLASTFDRMRSLDANFVGLTDGRFGGPHVQSYFMEFRNAVLRDGSLRRFFDSYSFPDDKAAAVREGELALTRFLDCLGHDHQVVHRYDDLSRRIIERDAKLGKPSGAGDMLRHGQPVNTTYAAWDLLLDDGFPFVKRNIFTSMGHLVDDVGAVRRRLFAMVSERDHSELIAEIGSV